MFQHAGIELASRNHAVPVTQQQIDKNTVARGERTAKGAIVDATRTARGATILQDARSDLGRAARLLAHIKRTLGTQAELAIDRDALAGTDLAAHNLRRLSRRGQAAKDLRAHQEYLGPCAFTRFDQLAMLVIEPVILAALAHQAGTYHDLHIQLSPRKSPHLRWTLKWGD
jgi:hypothetical protein